MLVLFPVTINTEAGLRTTSPRLIEMLRSFGATPRQIFFKLSLPSATPFILAGLKLGIGRGLIGVVVAELFGSRAGLGRLISQSADAFNMPELFAGVVDARRRRHRHDGGLRLARAPARAVDAGLSMTDPKLSVCDHSASASATSRCCATSMPTIARGEFISLVGPSGCGKTTFLRIVAGLEAASAGDVLLDGRAVREPGGDRGFVFQNDNLLPWRTRVRQRDDRPARSPAAPARPRSAARCDLLEARRPRRLRELLSRASSPAACASASISPARSRSIPKSC